MTTAVTRSRTVTARITTPNTPDPTPAPGGVFTVTVYMNIDPHHFGGYQPGHPLAAATRPDGSPLRLVFHTSTRIHDHEAAADAAYAVGNRQRADDHGRTWPSDIRPVSVGDVIKVTGPDHWILHLSVDPTGFSTVPEPTHLTGLTGTRATSRR
ncbi:hypothetical protein OG728_39470 (plasmid) [Streptomyces microflavus]|uniref:hypothetical protein n=1 Tax=Streptomyces microflavus TaxID=1919 RepID=UPI002E0EA094|nr:hypothetical protein OG728_39470 [Streptomyces microflavus]